MPSGLHERISTVELFCAKAAGSTSSEGGIAAHLSPGSGEPAAAARHRVAAWLLRLGSGDVVTALRLGRAVDEASMHSFAACARTLNNQSVDQSNKLESRSSRVDLQTHAENLIIISPAVADARVG